MSFDVDEFLDGYERPRRQVPICKRAGLAAELAELDAKLLTERAKGNLAGAPAEMLDRLAQLEAEIEASVVVFTLEARTTSEWADLLAAHPPTKDQAKQGHVANPETFDVAAVAACAVDPVVTIEQAKRMRGTLPPSEWNALVRAVYDLNQERTFAPKSLMLSAARHMSGNSSATPQNEGSLAEPSSDGNGGQ